jgi:hypothetical protein
VTDALAVQLRNFSLAEWIPTTVFVAVVTNVE